MTFNVNEVMLSVLISVCLSVVVLVDTAIRIL